MEVIATHQQKIPMRGLVWNAWELSKMDTSFSKRAVLSWRWICTFLLLLLSVLFFWTIPDAADMRQRGGANGPTSTFLRLLRVQAWRHHVWVLWALVIMVRCSGMKYVSGNAGLPRPHSGQHIQPPNLLSLHQTLSLSLLHLSFETSGTYPGHFSPPKTPSIYTSGL